MIVKYGRSVSTNFHGDNGWKSKDRSLAFSTIIVNSYYNLHSISIHEFTRQSLWIFFLFHEVLKFNYLITWLWNKGNYIVSNILISLDLWNCILRYYILLLTYTVPSYIQSYGISSINPLPPISDQEKISPYNLNTISSTEAMRIK